MSEKSHNNLPAVAKVLAGKRTWIEIDSRAARRNYDTFRKLIGRKTKLWAVVKSNAYGHGLMLFSKLMQKFGVDGFCVDSLVEGLRLRKEGIKKPILVLGPTLPALYADAAKNNITITISNFDALKALTMFVDKKSTKKNGDTSGKNNGNAGGNRVPEFHIKVDTGMHRQGFYMGDLPKVIRLLGQRSTVPPSPGLRRAGKGQLFGIYTHFASAKDINYPTYTERQFAEFQKAVKLFEKAGYKNLVKHVAATGGTLLDPKYHLDAVRVGIGLYGLWPSKELETQLGGRVRLHPILRWRAVVSEVKRLEKGDYVGYDLVERAPEAIKMGVVPVGYWHGFPRSLSGVGEVIVSGHRARVLGRVSMDLVTVRLLKNGKPGDVVTLIGRDGDEELLATEVARRAGTIHYELVTRLNPLIERIIV